MLAGLVDSYPQLVHQVEDSRVVSAKRHLQTSWLSLQAEAADTNRHTLGLLVMGMLSAAVLGDVFTSPTPDQIPDWDQRSRSGARRAFDR